MPDETASHERATPNHSGQPQSGASRRTPGPSLARHRSYPQSLSSREWCAAVLRSRRAELGALGLVELWWPRSPERPRSQRRAVATAGRRAAQSASAKGAPKLLLPKEFAQFSAAQLGFCKSAVVWLVDFADEAGVASDGEGGQCPDHGLDRPDGDGDGLSAVAGGVEVAAVA